MVAVEEIWDHRADLAERAINERHARKLWALPRTNLAVVAWPPSIKEQLYLRWDYWWQAHYLDCLVDAHSRTATRERRYRIKDTLRGIRIRNLRRLSTNRYHDDKSWLALAMGRALTLKKVANPFFSAQVKDLHAAVSTAVDKEVGAVPWRVGDFFYNAPTNGPAAIMLARLERYEEAAQLTDWMFETLLNPDGLIRDGVYIRPEGSEYEERIYTYCQGVALGACLELALAGQGDRFEDRIRALVQAVERHLANSEGVITADTGDGDGGLFKGILVRYLAQVALRFEGHPHTQRTAASMVMASAESLWSHRLEVDGLPIFSADWNTDAVLPHNFGVKNGSLTGTLGVVNIDERDLSVQLSGWMLLEMAAQISRIYGENSFFTAY